MACAEIAFNWVGNRVVACSGAPSPSKKGGATVAENSTAAETAQDISKLYVGAQGASELDGDLLWFQLQLRVVNAGDAELKLDGALILEIANFRRLSSEGDPRVVLAESQGVALEGTLASQEQVRATVSFAVPVADGAATLDVGLPFGLAQAQWAEPRVISGNAVFTG